MCMQIRQIKNSELDVVFDLHLEGLENELKLFNQIVPGKSVNKAGRDALKGILNHMMHTGEAGIFVAVENSEYLGYCLATKKVYPVENPKICGCINGLFVKEAQRRKNVGAQLFEQASRWFKNQGISYIELFHMINDPRATAFWEKMGFQKVQYSCVKVME